MKTTLRIIYGAGAIFMAVYSVSAQNTVNTNADENNYARQRMGQFRQQMFQTAIKASDFVGMKIENYQGQRLGNVNDLAVNFEAGRIIQVVMATGGFAGLDTTLVAVPPCALDYDLANNVLRLDTTQEQLQAAPKFDLSKWDDANASNQIAGVYAYFHEPVPGTSSRANSAASRDQRAMDKLRSDELAQKNAAAAADLFAPGAIKRESKLVGSIVENPQSQHLGRVEDLILDLPGSKILAVVVSPAEGFGLGVELNTLSPSAFRFNDADGNLILNDSPRTISGNESPSTGQTGREDLGYNSALTPLDQGNSPADLSTTTRIRQAIMADSAMSIDAQNVKIITQNGHVTLRGPVNSTGEKQRVDDIATRVAQPGNVSDQLIVTSNTKTTMNN